MQMVDVLSAYRIDQADVKSSGNSRLQVFCARVKNAVTTKGIVNFGIGAIEAET